MIYDQDKFEEFRKLAVTDVSKLQIGKTYYSNYNEDEMLLIGLQTNREHYEARGLTYEDEDPDVIGWMVYTSDNRLNKEHRSLQDFNVTNSYNPWMIFENKETAQRAAAEMPVTFGPASPDYYDDYDDWYDD